MELLTSPHKSRISGILICFDRVIFTGTLPQFCYGKGITSFLYHNGMNIFDYQKSGEPFRYQLRANAEYLAKVNKIEIEFVAK